MTLPEGRRVERRQHKPGVIPSVHSYDQLLKVMHTNSDQLVNKREDL